MERLTRQYYAGLHEHNRSRYSEGRAQFLMLSTWLCFVGCINHDVHNALKWGSMQWTDRDTLRKCFVVLESLRNGFGELVRHLGAWLASRLQFEDSYGGFASALWTCLQVNDKWANLLVDLEIRFHNGKLLIARKHEHRPDLIDQITVCLLYLWRFRKFSDSRWLSIGTSCAIIVGLPDFVHFVMDSPTSSDYYLRGFRMLDSHVLHLVAVGGMSSFLSDSVLARLLLDDRVARILPMLRMEISQELAYINNIPRGVWDLVASVTEFDGSDLRHACVSSSYTQAGFINARLRVAERPAFDLLHGSRSANLDALLAGDRPREEVKQRIWELLKRGCNRQDILDSLELMSQAGWSSTTVEQGHVAASVVMRFHHELTEARMRARAFVVQCRPLFTSSPLDRKIAGLESQVATVARRRPQNITGRQTYVRQLVDTAKEQAWGSRKVNCQVTKAVIQKHGKLWRAAGRARRLSCESAAESARQDKCVSHRDRKVRLLAEIREVQEKNKQMETGGFPFLRMTSCRLSVAANTELDDLFRSPRWTREHVSSLCDAATEPIGPLPPHIKQWLDDVPVQMGASDVVQAPTPAWLKLVAWNRDFFSKSVFRFVGAGGDVWHGTLSYAMQNPIFACFCRVGPSDRALPAVPGASFVHGAWCWWRHRFELSEEFDFTDEFIFQAELTASVLGESVKIGNALIVSDNDWQLLEDLRPMLPRHGDVAEAVAIAPAPAMPDVAEPRPPWLDHPWLLDHWADKGMRPKFEKVAPVAHSSDSESELSADSGTNWDASDLLALHEKRHELAAVGGHDAIDFGWELRGGKWTKEHKGVVFDCVSASARGLPMKQWCSDWGMNRAASWSTSLYTEDGACKLATSWVAKMQHLRNVCDDHGSDPGFAFT
jgi:hypothetical protein